MGEPAARRRQLTLQSERLPQRAQVRGRQERIPVGARHAERLFLMLPRLAKRAAGRQDAADSVQRLGLFHPVAGLARLAQHRLVALPGLGRVTQIPGGLGGREEAAGRVERVVELDEPRVGLLGQAARPLEVPHVHRHESQPQVLVCDELARAESPCDGERFLIVRLGTGEIAGVIRRRSHPIESARHCRLIARRGEQAAGLAETAERFRRPAHGVEGIPLEEQGLADDLALGQALSLVGGGRGGPQLLLGISQPASDLCRLEVDPEVVRQRRRQLAQRFHGGESLGAAAADREAVGQLQAVVEIVGIEGPQRAVDLRRFDPLPAGLVKPCLDRQPLLVRQRGREADGLPRFLQALRVVAETSPGARQGRMNHRRVGLRRHRLLQQVARALRIVDAQLVETLSVGTLRLRAFRLQLLGRADLLRRGVGPAELTAHLPAEERHQVEEIVLGAGLGQRGDRVAGRRLEHAQIDAKLAVASCPHGEIGAHDHQVGAQAAMDLRQVVLAQVFNGGPRRQSQGLPDARDVLARRDPHL